MIYRYDITRYGRVEASAVSVSNQMSNLSLSSGIATDEATRSDEGVMMLFALSLQD